MSSSTLRDIAVHFRVSDIPGAMVPSTRLSNILERMHHGLPLSTLSLKYLLDHDLIDLHSLATGEVAFEEYAAAAIRAKQSRQHAAELERETKEAERLARETAWQDQYARQLEAEEAARKALESDPKHIARMKSQALRRKYGMDYIDEPLYPRMMAIIKRLDAGGRLTEDDVVWLNTGANEHFTDALRDAYHLVEAKFLASDRGASERSIDSDLRGILRRLDKGRREAMRAFLMAENPDRYSWANNVK